MKVLGKDKAYPVSENDLDSKQNDSDTVESEPSATPTEVPDLIPTPTSIPTEEPCRVKLRVHRLTLILIMSARIWLNYTHIIMFTLI